MKIMTLALLVGNAVSMAALAADFERTPLPENHPLVGMWRINVPGMACSEVYDIRSDGTMNVTSSSQVVKAEFSVGKEQLAGGFYRWTDHILSENGQSDCMGNVMEVGHSATHYITVHTDGERFLLCQQPNLDTCIGPFNREAGI